MYSASSKNKRISTYFGFEDGNAVFVGIDFGERLRIRGSGLRTIAALSVFLLVDRSPSANEDISSLQKRM